MVKDAYDEEFVEGIVKFKGQSAQELEIENRDVFRSL